MEAKIDQILSQLTLEEKVRLLAGADAWHSHAVERLGIPSLRVSDGPNGVRGQSRDSHPVTSASFPIGTAMGATWNPPLIEQVGKALGQETRSKGAHVLLAPTVNLHRAPLAGRNFECFSEDPFLTAEMAAAYITGLQSEGVAACVKHFVCNDQEFERFSISAEVPERALHELYLVPFRKAIKEAGSWTIMSAYNRINGTYASENKRFLLDILKGAWGFDGLVISDWYGTYSDEVAAGGCDLEMPGPARWMGEKVLEAVKAGDLDEAVVDDKVRRLLRTMFRAGVFDAHPREERSENKPEHQALIRKAGAEAIVLLKNEGELLPLNLQAMKRAAVIGPLGRDITFQGGGSSQVAPHYVVSPLTVLGEQFAGEVLYSEGCRINKQPPAMDDRWLKDDTGKPSPVQIEYFDNPNLNGKPVHSAVSPRTELSWFGETAPHWDPNHFSLAMTGRFTAPASGTYTFTLTHVGRGQLFVDGELKIDAWEEEPTGWRHNHLTLTLEEGESHAFKINFASQPGGRWRMVRLGVEAPLPEDAMEQAVELARGADAAIVIVGLTPEWEGEGFDRVNMDLPGEQNELVAKVAAVNPNTIVVLNTGSPVHMPWLDKVKSVVQMWYLGQESGNALVDVLSGAAEPGGRLPTTFPKRLQDNPTHINYPGENGVVRYGEGIFMGYRYYDHKEIEPLFPFGHGLSYTTFAYRELGLQATEIHPGDTLTFSVLVENTGKRAGSEVVQVYVRDETASLARPPKELKAFKKVHLAPGEHVQLEFTVSEQDLAYYDDAKKGWVAEPGEFALLVGSSARDIRLQASFTLMGE